nr:hypothetical protein [Tanacetum cinerariifolium]
MTTMPDAIASIGSGRSLLRDEVRVMAPNNGVSCHNQLKGSINELELPVESCTSKPPPEPPVEPIVVAYAGAAVVEDQHQAVELLVGVERLDGLDVLALRVVVAHHTDGGIGQRGQAKCIG